LDFGEGGGFSEKVVDTKVGLWADAITEAISRRGNPKNWGRFFLGKDLTALFRLMKYRLFFESRAERGSQKIIWFYFSEKRCNRPLQSRYRAEIIFC
jgi:hypothetical protein